MKSLLFSWLVFCAVIKTQAQIELVKDSKTGKFGFTDENGDWVIPPQFEEGEDFFDYDFAFVKKGSKWGLINRKGEAVLPFAYDKPGYPEYDDNLTPVVKNKKHGMINKTTGTEIIPCVYDRKLIFQENFYWTDTMLLLAIKENKAGLIDASGKVIINFLYDTFEREPFTAIETVLKSGVILTTQNKKSGILDNQGNTLVPFKYDEVDVREYPDTLLFDIAIKKKFGIYSAELKKEIVPPTYDDKIFFEENFAVVSRKKKYGVLNRAGKEVVPCTLTISQAMEELDKLSSNNN